MDIELSRTIIWAVLGIGLVSLEVVTGTFFLLFFGIAALLVAAIRVAGLDLFWAELVLFSGLSGALVFLLRGRLRQAIKPHGHFRGDAAETITLSAGLTPRGQGQIEYHGAPWTAVNNSDVALPAGTRVHIVKVEGVTLFVAPKGD